MAKEQVSKGADFSVAKLDRSYGGVEKEILKVDGASGDLVIKDLAGNEKIKVNAETGLLEINGAAAVGPTGSDLALSGDLAVTGDVGFYGTSPVAQPSAYTQTYSTASKTVPDATSNTIADSSGGTASTSAIAVITNAANAGSADVGPVQDAVATLNAELELVKADLVAAKKVINALIDDLQALGLVG